MEWELMMECDIELCGFGFAGLAPEEEVELFDPDMLLFEEISWIWPFSGPEYDPAENSYGGGWTAIICPPGVPPGTYSITKIWGAISDTVPFGVYTFSADPSHSTSFTDGGGHTFDVELGPGYLEVIEHLLFLDLAGCPHDSIPEAATTEIEAVGQCTADDHLGTVSVSCDVEWPAWATWDGGDWGRPATGTLTLLPSSHAGPWTGNFIFDFQDLGNGEHAYDTCAVYVWDSVEIPEFVRGDADSDGSVKMSDALATLIHLYLPGSDTLSCLDAGDSDDDGEIQMGDALYALKYLYVPGEPQPPAPFPFCGPDPSPDDLGCGLHQCMGDH
jgi:hypothetical protein